MAVLDSRPTLEAPDDDPYLWLEEIESARVLDWVEAQNAATLQCFRDAGVAADRTALKAIFDARTTFPFPTGAPENCSTLGGTPRIRAECGGRRRSKAS